MGVWVSPVQRQLLLAQRLLVVDLELTCGPGITQDVQDIIEVGVCALEMGRPVSAGDAASTYIRPTRSAVTPFCTKLTGITPAKLKGAGTFLESVPGLKKMLHTSQVDAWVSWGADQNLMQRQCDAVGVANPFDVVPHVDIKRLLTPLVYQLTGGVKPQGAGAGVGLSTAMKQLGIEFIGRQHGGADDAFNTARLLETTRQHVAPYLAAADTKRAGPRP